MALVAGLAGCSSSDSGTAPGTTPSTVTISGKISSDDNPAPAGEAGVAVRGIYTDTDPANTSTTTAADGTYSLTVEANKAVSVQLEKAGFAILNSQKVALTANVTDGDEDLVSDANAQIAIDLALGGNTTPLANKAWLAIDVTDALGAEVNGVSISATPAPDVEVYTECDGTDSLGNVTTGATCAPDRVSVMYLAYYDTAPGDVTVTANGDTQIAPVRMGQITGLDFEQ